MRVRVEVSGREGVYDPEAASILRAAQASGFAEVRTVRVVRVFELEIDGSDGVRVAELADALLANPVIEAFRVLEVADGA